MLILPSSPIATLVLSEGSWKTLISMTSCGPSGASLEVSTSEVARGGKSGGVCAITVDPASEPIVRASAKNVVVLMSLACCAGCSLPPDSCGSRSQDRSIADDTSRCRHSLMGKNVKQIVTLALGTNRLICRGPTG